MLIKNISLLEFRRAFTESKRKKVSWVILAIRRSRGSIRPTKEEEDIVQKAEDLGGQMGVQLKDFFILGKRDEYFSFWDAGLLKVDSLG